MGCDVFANSDEISCKAGDGKVIASFPDVCLTPPSPPAGPIPVPYPNTSFSKDMMNGSKTVKIKGQEVMLKDKSFYKTAPLGDEAATRGLGANVITHVITGKTYFTMWSMDVKFEGQNVDRHTDITTSNHMSLPPGCPTPNPNLGAMARGEMEDAYDQCACCGQPRHSKGPVTTFDDFYGLNQKDASGQLTQKAKDRREYVEKVKVKEGCKGCQGKVLPEPPCNVFRSPICKTELDAIKAAHRNNAPNFRTSKGMPAKSQDVQTMFGISQPEADKIVKVNHLTPKGAGGCPTGAGNLQMHFDLCDTCQGFDDEFGNWQKEHSSDPSC